jgi:predicted ATPase/class 3 adenylate cyclase
MERAMPELPFGTVTFLFTDIEGSTALWERDRKAMAAAVDRHLALLRAAIEAHCGVLFKTVGDAVQAAFPVAPDALAAAVAAQQALSTQSWPDPPGPLLVRMALHAGHAEPRDGDYLTAPLNRLARLLASGHGGQILLSQAVQQLVRDAIPTDVILRDLGRHRLRDLQEPEEIFQVVAPGVPDAFPPLRTLPSHPTNMPAPPTALIGRDADVAAVLGWIVEGARLVTLTGPGGTGKTRLAVDIAAEALEQYPEGAFFVDLAPIRDPALVVPTIAAVLGVRETAGESLPESLARYLADRRMLLVLDNCEQVLEAAGDVAALLTRCPHLAILTTSREPLRLRAERVFSVAPLLLPDRRHSNDPTALFTNPSIALFVERAQAADTNFTLSAENGPAVAAICRRLDGLPLAIELAAARVRLLPPEALLVRLERSLPLLTSGARDAPARQRTLRDTIAWSHDLLTPQEQALARRLSVFVGGWTLEAAEAVTSLNDDVDVLTGLGNLVERSLVRRTEGLGDDPRFGMLETIREYEQERLTESGEEEATRDAHAQHVVQEVDAFRHRIERSTRATAQAQMVRDLDNVRAALAWAIERHDGIAAQAIAGLLGPFWMDRGLIREGRDWIERALVVPGFEPIITPEAHYWAGFLALFQGDLERAEFHGETGLARSREASNRFGEGGALFLLGDVALMRGDQKQGTELCLTALHLLQTLPDEPWHNRLDAVVVDNLGALALQQGDLAAARHYFEESLAIWRRIDHPWGVSRGLSALASLALRDGDAPQALRLYADCLERDYTLHNTFSIAGDLQGIGKALLARGNAEDAARLLGAADRLYGDMEFIMWATERASVEAERDRLRGMLGEERFAEAWDAGHALERDQAVAQALALANAASEATPTGER